MRLPPRRPTRVVWEEGMYLAPQHFQAQRHHFEDALAHSVEMLFPFPYGITSAALDSDALAAGTLSLVHAHGILPDGTVVALPEVDPLPAPSPLAERFSPTRAEHLVHLALPAWRADRRNVRPVASANGWTNGSGDAGDAGDPRYLEVIAQVRDETAGQESVEVHLAAKNLRLVLDDELASDDVALPLARIRRDGAGRFVVDPEYVPPCLHVAASERLVGMLRGVVGMLEAKGAALAASLAPAPVGGAPSAYVGNELATRWLLNAVRSAEAPLRHLLAARRVHPERLWTELARLAGALCTFSLTAQPRDLPAYDHDDLGGCFGALERHLRAHLDVVVAARAIVVPLTKSSAVLHVGDVPDPRCYEPGARWFLGVRSSAGAAAMVANAPRLLKVCASMYVLELVRRAWNGLAIEHVPAPPAGIAPRRELAYFELTMDGPCAEGLRTTKQMGVYVPDEIPDASFELAILVAES